jgi:hypothetical protein
VAIDDNLRLILILRSYKNIFRENNSHLLLDLNCLLSAVPGLTPVLPTESGESPSPDYGEGDTRSSAFLHPLHGNGEGLMIYDSKSLGVR